MNGLGENTSHIDVTNFTFMTMILSEYLVLPSSHSVFLWSIYSFLHFLLSFQTYIPRLPLFLLTNDLDVDFTEKN